ncbi:cupin domain-containing protein [Paenibacillus sp. sgz500958]|uniref:cupin domain-containing protein n=1 Tax=Paenibacillus sp. sgz500958 TaxID=3242475 RepID=UPI0036D334CE
MDYTSPQTQFTYDLSCNTVFKKDPANFLNELSIKQLNTLDNLSLLDIYLSKSNVVEPHYHQNASELVYGICGSAVVSLLNPFTKELLNFLLCPGQVVNIPQGWWHYEVATVDHTHLLAIFNAPIPETIYGSDILSLTPANVLAHTYCLDETKVKEALAPIKETTVIGPPVGCCEPGKAHGAMNAMPMGAMNAMPQPYYMIPQMTTGYGYGAASMPGYFAQGYAQQYRQQPYVQEPYRSNPGDPEQ